MKVPAYETCKSPKVSDVSCFVEQSIGLAVLLKINLPQKSKKKKESNKTSKSKSQWLYLKFLPNNLILIDFHYSKTKKERIY